MKLKKIGQKFYIPCEVVDFFYGRDAVKIKTNIESFEGKVLWKKDVEEIAIPITKDKVYLIGGTTPRTDLDNYEDAFLDKEEAEKCLKWWQKEQGQYEDFHIDSIEISEKFDDRDYCNGCINYNEFGRNCTIGVEDIRQCVDYESYDEH